MLIIRFFRLLSAGLVFFGFSVRAYAQGPRLCPRGNQDDLNNLPSLQCGEEIFSNVLKGLFALAGIAAFIVLLMGGFKYITAGGDDKAVGEARKMLTGAVGGLVLVVAAYALLNILTYYIFGSNRLFTFTVPG